MRASLTTIVKTNLNKVRSIKSLTMAGTYLEGPKLSSEKCITNT